MGAVLRGHDPELGRDLAVKVLLPDHQHDPVMVSRFTEEAQIGGQLQHPGVVPVYEVGRSSDQRPYFTMKLIRGRTLATLLKERAGPADDLPRLLQVFEQVCQTLAYAHSRGVIHRDLKPSNVMVGAFGEVQVMDWGLAKVLGGEGGERPRPGPQAPGLIRTVRSAGAGAVSQPGHVLGTPAYMAPEQARGEVDRLDERCDVFGLGAILCEILTGQPPFPARSADEALAQAMRGDVADALARLEGCGAETELVRLAQACLAADTGARPRDARVVAAAMTSYHASVAQRLRRAELERAQAQVQAGEERKRRRLTALLAAAGLGLVLLAAGGGLWFQWVQAERRAEAAQQEQALRQDVEIALAQAANRRKGFLFREGQAMLEQARQRLEPAGPEDLRRRVEQALADLLLAERFDAARLQVTGTVQGKLDGPGGEQRYAAAFADGGLGRQGEDVEAVAARVRDSALREEIVAALDDWAGITKDESRRAWLLEVARRADRDPWRDRLRQPQVWKDRAALTRLAAEAKEAALSPQLATALSRALGPGEDAVLLLTAAQKRFPEDFWLNFQLAAALYGAQRYDDAAGFYRAALARRPLTLAAHTNLGNALNKAGRLVEGMDQYKEALRLDPNYTMAYYNLGIALTKLGRPDEATDYFGKAGRLDPKDPDAPFQTGMCLQDLGQLDEAMAAYRRVIHLDAKYAAAHHNLAMCLRDSGHTEEAIAEFREAVQLDPGGALGHEALADALLRRGRFAEARAAAQHGLDRLPGTEPARQALRQQLEQSERLLALDARLPALLQGKERPGATEQLDLARLCRDHSRPYAAVRLYAAAFAAKPALADDLPSRNRYAAACAAARAAADQGTDQGRLGEPERAGLRRQALDWLRGELALRAKLLQSGKSVGWPLRAWQTDDALAGVRDRAALAKLPEDERQEWQRLWADVAALLADDPLEQGRAHAARRAWGPAADCYARALKADPTDDGHFWFEYAAVLLLAGDRKEYAQACAHMVEKCCQAPGPRAYHVARACTLAPDSVADAAQTGRLAEKELTTYARLSWSLSEQGALRYRAGRFKEAVPLFEQSLQADPKPGRAVVNWLWLALAKQRLGKSEEARRWLDKAKGWLDRYGDGIPSRAEEELGLHLHNWLEAHVLRAEAETLLGPAPSKPK
jgi:serine/threonine-protein kinase